MIKVVNKRNHKPTIFDFYVGRGNPLGNQWTHIPSRITLAKYIVESKDEAIRLYHGWLLLQLMDKRSAAFREFHRLIKFAKQYDINLVCYCAPGKCHADVIKKLLENYIDNGSIGDT